MKDQNEPLSFTPRELVSTASGRSINWDDRLNVQKLEDGTLRVENDLFPITVEEFRKRSYFKNSKGEWLWMYKNS